MNYIIDGVGMNDARIFVEDPSGNQYMVNKYKDIYRLLMASLSGEELDHLTLYMKDADGDYYPSGGCPYILAVISHISQRRYNASRVLSDAYFKECWQYCENARNILIRMSIINNKEHSENPYLSEKINEYRADVERLTAENEEINEKYEAIYHGLDGARREMADNLIAAVAADKESVLSLALLRSYRSCVNLFDVYWIYLTDSIWLD